MSKFDNTILRILDEVNQDMWQVRVAIISNKADVYKEKYAVTVLTNFLVRSTTNSGLIFLF